MAVEVPSEVAQFLDFVGVPWINVNEDRVRDFADHVRQFAADLGDVHQDATATLTSLGAGYSGAAYEALMQMWSGKSSTHLTELIEGCGVLAGALDGAAGFIAGQKSACLVELAGLAVSFLADQAAAVVTFGAAEAAEALIVEGAEKLMEFTEQQIEQYVIGQVLDAALRPLMSKMDGAVQGLLLSADQSGLGAAGIEVGPSFSVDLDHVGAHAARMREHAQTVSGHTQKFTTNLRGLSFS
ncbi:MAG TPA: WXG100 family type VII secretion target [Actinocrinis sp.]|nr:WXG100 family type VII secretion target [Actinocrinis sp.]